MDITALKDELIPAIHRLQAGDPKSARMVFVRYLCHAPSSQSALALLGVCDTETKAFSAALPWMLRANCLDPLHATTLSNLGIIYSALEDENRSELHHLKAICLMPELGDTYKNLGNLYLKTGQDLKALALFLHLIRLLPQAPEAHVLLGHARQFTQKDLGLMHFRVAIALDPTSATLDLAHALQRSDDIGSAFLWFRRATLLTGDPSILADAMAGKGYCYLAANEHTLALGELVEAFTQEKDPLLLTFILYCALKTMSWRLLETYLPLIDLAIAEDHTVGNPFPLLLIEKNPSKLLNASKSYIQYLRLDQERFKLKKNPGQTSRIVLGYFSSDLNDTHPVSRNLLPLISHHDRHRFKVVAFSLAGKLESNTLHQFDEVIDVSTISDEEAAMVAQKVGLDLAVDLNGYTRHGRPGIFSFRPAPLQINYLGYPGTMGTTFHDYILADEIVIPGDLERFYSEEVIRLPHFFMPYDFTSNLGLEHCPPNRGDFGLPVDRFVFCSFNELHKLTPEIFEAWIRILKGAPNAVLWISNRGDKTDQELMKTFESRGIDAERIIIATRVDSHAQHLSRLSLADLMLDTFPYNSHTTACDAISQGLPIVTLMGEIFASRVSGSLLKHVGGEEMIAAHIDAYVDLALGIAQDPLRHLRLKDTLRKGLHTLITPRSFSQSIESTYIELLSRQTLPDLPTH